MNKTKPHKIQIPYGAIPSRRELEVAIRRALKQSPNIIIDLRNMQLSEAQCLRNIKTQLKKRKQIKRTIVIIDKHRVIEL